MEVLGLPIVSCKKTVIIVKKVSKNLLDISESRVQIV